MCFEFEYLYWAKLEEEARQRKEEAQRTAEAQRSDDSAVQAPAESSTPTPA